MSCQAFTGTRRTRCTVAFMLHLRQAVHRAARRLRGHTHLVLSLRLCCICAKTFIEQPGVVRGTHSMLCCSVHAEYQSGHAPSSQTGRKAGLSCSRTTATTHRHMFSPTACALSGVRGPSQSPENALNIVQLSTQNNTHIHGHMVTQTHRHGHMVNPTACALSLVRRLSQSPDAQTLSRHRSVVHTQQHTYTDT